MQAQPSSNRPFAGRALQSRGGTRHKPRAPFVFLNFPAPTTHVGEHKAPRLNRLAYSPTGELVDRMYRFSSFLHVDYVLFRGKGKQGPVLHLNNGACTS